MSFNQIVSYPFRLILFFLTYPVRIIFGIDFDWGIL